MTAARVSLANHARGDGFAIEQLLTSSDASKTIYFTNKHSHKILAGAARDVLTVYQGGTKMLYAQRRACDSVRSAQRSCLRLRLPLRTKRGTNTVRFFGNLRRAGQFPRFYSQGDGFVPFAVQLQV